MRHGTFNAIKRTAPLLIALFSAAPRAAADNGDARPNILWLTSEDNSAGWLGCYGNPQATTPRLDRLAAEGFRYRHVYADVPVCAPTRSTWITGVLALSMGTHPMRSHYDIPHDTIRYYPDFLKKNGYYTGNSTKRDYNIGGRDDAEFWDNPGKVDIEALHQQQPFFQVINIFDSHESKAFGDTENTRHDPADVTLATYHPDVPVIRENYALYHDAVENMDTRVGEVLDQLDASGLTDNTIVIYNSDHGGVMPRSKRFLFQNGLHCPLIIRIPERYRQLWPAEQPGATIDRLVSFVDMPKTWLSITRSEIPDLMQGTVFLGPQAEPEPAYHFAFRGRMGEAIDNARSLNDKRFLYIRNYMPYVPWMQHVTYLWQMHATRAWESAVRDGSANALQSRFFAPKDWTEELYDMELDPDNTQNLIDDPEHQAVAKRMRRELRAQQERIFDAGLMPESERVRLAELHGITLYEMARRPDIYDVSALLDAADLALEQNADHLPQLRAMLKSADVGQRYWGIVGCFLLDDTETGQKALTDASHDVRAMAAWLLIRSGDADQAARGQACLLELIEQRSYALLKVMAVVDWMGEPEPELIVAVGRLEFVDTYPKEHQDLERMRDHLVERFGG